MRTNDNQFKQNLESITYEDVIELRDAKKSHPIKLDDLNIDLKTADQYVEVMTEFLSALNFTSDRIDAFECRSRTGFFPHSHNKGGIEGICYRDVYSTWENTGFEGTDAALKRGYEYVLECFLDDNKTIQKDSMSESDLEKFDEYRLSDEDTVQFQARVMMTSETTANVDLYVSTSDSPYHRTSDDKFEIEIEFKSPAGMKRKLNALLKNNFVQCLASNVKEGF